MLRSSKVIKRYNGNPVLSKKDIPYDAELIFNAGVTKYNGKYVMVFRNDFGYSGGGNFAGTNMGFAESNDGVNWSVASMPCFIMHDTEVNRAYDPRLTVIDGICYMCFAIDTKHGIRGCIASTEDFYNFDIISMTVPDNRNMVLFPEKINNKFVRLERPMPIYGRGGVDRFDIWLADSPDLMYWGNNRLVLGVEDVSYANNKIGPAAPPIKTSSGYLTLFHAVDLDKTRGKNGWEDKWQKFYYAGIMLLDLENPHEVIGMYSEPLIAPEMHDEIDGFRSNVIFPGGMILEESGEVKIYYGASDTVEYMATADVDELITLCK